MARRQKQLKIISKGQFTPKNLIRVVLLVLCGAILGFNVYLANANSLLGNQLPMPFGCGAAVVLSGSMEPELSKGDLIIVSKSETYEKNDIVVFQSRGSLVVHRIVDIDKDTVITKGDANNTTDEPINIIAIKGKVRFCIPFVGNIVNFIKTPIGTICIIVVAILLIEIPRRNEKQKDDEEKQKIIDEINRLKGQN